MPRVDTAFTWGDDKPPNIPWRDSVLYETHLRGFTMLHPDVPEYVRGTCAGFSLPAVIDHLKAVGVTAVEFLPVHAFVQDRHLIARGLSNYWGYNTIGFFAPGAALSGDAVTSPNGRPWSCCLHDAGIEVMIDVVYNHTAEGNHLGPTLSFKGIDNASYYKLSPDDPRFYWDCTGCGNTLNLSHPRVLQMVMDSLRYWVEVMHVDGFRFDLTSALARDPYDFDYGSGFLDAVRQDPVLSQGQADRRALGPRRRRLSGRRLPAGLVGVERQVPRHVAPLLEGRSQPDPGAGGAADRLGGHAGLARPAPDRIGQLHHRA